MDDAARDRARAIGEAIQRAVSGRLDLAVSPVGIGLDALSSMMIHNPEALAELSGFLTLAVEVWNHVVAGDTSPAVAGLLAGEPLDL